MTAIIRRRLAAGGLATVLLAAVLALFGASDPAFANGPFCNTSDPMPCAGTVDFNLNSAVGQAHTGRTVQWVASNGYLKLTGGTNKCIGLTDDGFAVVRGCPGGLGIVFTRTNDGGTTHKYTATRNNLTIGGDGTFGHQYRGVDTNASGWLKVFAGP